MRNGNRKPCSTGGEIRAGQEGGPSVSPLHHAMPCEPSPRHEGLRSHYGYWSRSDGRCSGCRLWNDRHSDATTSHQRDRCLPTVQRLRRPSHQRDAWTGPTGLSPSTSRESSSSEFARTILRGLSTLQERNAAGRAMSTPIHSAELDPERPARMLQINGGLGRRYNRWRPETANQEKPMTQWASCLTFSRPNFTRIRGLDRLLPRNFSLALDSIER